jgi:hypothetical protein
LAKTLADRNIIFIGFWNDSEHDLAIGPKIAKLASRHSERAEGHHVIEMHRHFPNGRFGPMY